MKTIGFYRQPSGGDEYHQTPIYGTRRQYLPCRDQTFLQVQVSFLGSCVWINVDAQDVTVD